MPVMTEPPRDKTLCPTCGTLVYIYNQHECAECGAQTCAYCETAHAAGHKEKPDAKIPQ